MPAWAGGPVLFALCHVSAAAAAYAALGELRAVVPRGEALLAAAAGSFVWLAGLWAAVAVVARAN